MMKKILFFNIVLLYFFLTPVCAQDWKEKGGEHFITYYTTDEEFAKKVLDKAEVYYRNIAKDLGYPRYSQFWLWDDRVKIYIHPDQAAYLKETVMPEWSAGMANYNKMSIASFTGSSEFLISILPHEIAHLIFRDFVGFKGEIPLWLDEGVAQWSEAYKRDERHSIVLKLYEEDKVLSMDDLMNMDIMIYKGKELVFIRDMTTREGDPGVLFLDYDTLVNTYYLQAVSVVDFLVTRYGANRFTSFCRELRDGKSLDEALGFVYSVYIRDIKGLEEAWKRHLEEQL